MTSARKKGRRFLMPRSRNAARARRPACSPWWFRDAARAVAGAPRQAPSFPRQGGRGARRTWRPATQREADARDVGRTFPLLAGMVRRILENDDDPAWPRLSKGDTPCETPAELLKLTARCTRGSRLSIGTLTHWVDWMLRPDISTSNPRVWLHILKRALTGKTDNDPAEFWEQDTLRFITIAR